MGIEPNPVDEQDDANFEQSLKLLDRTISWLWWNTISMIVLLLLAIAVLFAPDLPFVSEHGELLSSTLVSAALLVLILVLVVNTFLKKENSMKLVRKHLADQIQFTAKQRRKADKFQNLAITDPLTGLYNRRFGEEKLESEIARVEVDSLELAIIVADLDYFKRINDQFGHSTGDEVLKEFARHLKKSIRSCDVPIRTGGDEFLVILPECEQENAELILSRLKPFEIEVNRQKILVAYSCGIAQFQAGDTLQTIIQRADNSLYSEKANRKRMPA